MAQVCRAGNAECGLATGRSLLMDPLRPLRCDVCCTEPGFCLECKCILCGMIIPAECERIQCLEKLGNGVCGHSAHLDCALNCNMAGVVQELDVQYLCRRCDKTMDLLPRAVTIMQSVPAAPSGEIKEKLASYVLRLVHGSKREDVKAALKALKEGMRTEKPHKKKLQRPNAKPSQGTRSMFCERLLLDSPEKAADEKPDQNRERDETEVQAGAVPMDVDVLSPVNANALSEEPPVLSVKEEENDGRDAMVTREQLFLHYQEEIERAIANLRRVQEQEVLVAKEKLVSQMNSVLNEYQVFESEEASCTEATEKMQEHLRKLISEREKFDSMLQIGEGFGCVSRELLRTSFDWPPSQSR